MNNTKSPDLYTQSKELTEFYDEYYNWLLAGAPDRRDIEINCFVRHFGLCSNLSKFCERKGYFDLMKRKTIYMEITLQFWVAGLNSAYPFDTDSSSYYKNCDLNKCHENPKRIAWVAAHSTK